jgi:ribosomal protein L22|tara:strand:- start:767 stop:1375 length:609 start_codon:yes stop_codon:yes gene_type:complete
MANKNTQKSSQSLTAEKLDSRKGSDSKNPEKLSSAGELAKEKTMDKEKVGAKEEKKVEVKKKEVVKKDVAIANGVALRISPKQSKFVCRTIVGKTPEAAIARLQAVVDEKRPVPMAGLEIGHRKGRGLAGGRFPKTACVAIMEVVKQAGANAVVNGIEAPVIRIAKADRAAAPLRRGGRRAKRCHVHIEVVEKTKLIKRKKK